MAQPSVDWPLWINLLQVGCASGGVVPGWPPGHTRRAVAIDPGVVEDSRNDQKLQKLKDYNDIER